METFLLIILIIGSFITVIGFYWIFTDVVCNFLHLNHRYEQQDNTEGDPEETSSPYEMES